jgi:tetratricopeptide (TPR) repeat protein
MNNLASSLGSLGRHKEALAQGQEALALYQKILPNDHPNVVSCTNNVGVHLRKFVDGAPMKERLSAALDRKDKGAAHFKSKHYQEALGQYDAALKFIPDDPILGEALETKAKLLGNMSLCLFKLERYSGAAARGEDALGLDPKNVKFLLRVEAAHLHAGDYIAATQRFKSALALDPGNKDAIRGLQLLKTKIKDQKQKDKNLFRGAFS